ncbi:MAG: glycosyltransferase [Ignavibacteria bacterium]|nr:glycosyltransferase [Ignavibacteria bacterium]
MKIAFISPFYPYRGGIAQFADSLYLELSRSNELLAVNYKRQYPKFLFPGSTQYVSDSDKNRKINSLRITDSLNPFSWKKVSRAITDFRADVALLSYWMPFFAPSLGNIAGSLKKNKIKTIGLLHNVRSHEKMVFHNLFAGYFFRRCDGLVVLNRKAAEELKEIVPDAKYEILFHPFYNHYGIKISRSEALNKLNIDENKKVVLFFGFIRDYKGLDILIEAMSSLDDSYVLIIAGEVYGDFRKYDELINKLKLDRQIIKHIRYIPESEIPLFFSAADVCVLPYRSASQSGITGIAYHFDVPVIVTDVGGLAEEVIDMKTGIITKPVSEIISSALRDYFEKNLRNQFIGEIRNYRTERSWEKFTEKLVQFISNVIRQYK